MFWQLFRDIGQFFSNHLVTLLVLSTVTPGSDVMTHGHVNYWRINFFGLSHTLCRLARFVIVIINVGVLNVASLSETVSEFNIRAIAVEFPGDQTREYKLKGMAQYSLSP
jgi:hypothetical protein